MITVSVSETGSRYDAVNIVLSAFAWMRTPGNVFDLSTGTSFVSAMGAVAPMNTTFSAESGG